MYTINIQLLTVNFFLQFNCNFVIFCECMAIKLPIFINIFRNRINVSTSLVSKDHCLKEKELKLDLDDPFYETAS